MVYVSVHQVYNFLCADQPLLLNAHADDGCTAPPVPVEFTCLTFRTMRVIFELYQAATQKMVEMLKSSLQEEHILVKRSFKVSKNSFVLCFLWLQTHQEFCPNWSTFAFQKCVFIYVCVKFLHSAAWSSFYVNLH